MPTLAELESELENLEIKRAATAKLVAALREYEATVGKVTPIGNGSVIIRQRVRSGRAETPANPTETAAMDLLNERQAPISTNDVIDLLRRRGEPIPDSNPTNVISARLSYSKRVKGKRGQGWWFPDRSWPDENVELWQEAASRNSSEEEENNGL